MAVSGPSRGSVVTAVPAPSLDRLRDAVGAVCDPELPPLTLVDLGILRSVERSDDEVVVVTVTPTYSGCPAVEYIENEIAAVLEAEGCDRYRVERSLAPAWTTEWVTDDGRRKLTELGIAPPPPVGDGAPGSGRGPTPVPVILRRRASAGSTTVACPHCGSTDTEMVSPFGSTACKALHRCRSCAEPFDQFKAL
ncbi:MAG: 1,2-phenylacetyl-CoA epoxidase subunit PaaD [Acidimicrobiales bacterium]